MIYINKPVLPDWDKAQPRDNWNAIKRVLDAYFTTLDSRVNAAFMKDGSDPMKVTTTTLPAGTTYFQGRVRSDTINAYLDAGNWRSWDTARPSWRITQDMAGDRTTIERAAASTGNLTWVTQMTLSSAGAIFPVGGFTQPGTGGETLRTIRGRVSSAGAVVDGTGFTSVRNSVGDYTVTYSTAFSGVPTPIVNAYETQERFVQWTGGSPGTSASFRIFILNITGTLTDTPFGFQVKGPV